MRIAIVGTHPLTWKQAPFSDTSWEIWGCSLKHESTLPRQTAWFEIHRILEVFGPYQVYTDWLKTLPRLYIMEPGLSAYPNATRYPREEMIAEFGPYFFTSTIAWMFGYAISLKPEAIGIYGVETKTAEEYLHQRPAYHHFTQVARDRGIQIVTAPNSTLLIPPGFYGDAVVDPVAYRIGA